MPSIVGAVNINSVGPTGVVNFGDSFFISPKSTSKSFAGSGSFSTGNFVNNNNGVSATNTIEPTLADSNIAATT